MAACLCGVLMLPSYGYCHCSEAVDFSISYCRPHNAPVLNNPESLNKSPLITANHDHHKLQTDEEEVCCCRHCTEGWRERWVGRLRAHW